MITFLDKNYIPYSGRYTYYKLKVWGYPYNYKISRKRQNKYLMKKLCLI